MSNNEFISSLNGPEGVWTSQTIDISSASSVDLSIDVQGTGGLDPAGDFKDHLEVAYMVDGNETQLFYVDGPFNNEAVKSLSATGISGNNLQVVVRALTTGGDEVYHWDNISVTSNGTTNPPSSSAEILIRARGKAGAEKVELRLNDNAVQSWTVTTNYQDYTYTVTDGGTQNIKVAFTNDQGTSLDLYVDYIEVNGNRMQAEDQQENTGVWQNGSCGGSFAEPLHCGGYINFGNVDLSGSARMASIEALEEAHKPYPNPLEEGQSITLPKIASAESVTVNSIEGKQYAVSYTLEAGDLIVNVAGLSNGTYAVKVVTAEEVIVETFSIQK